MTYWEQFLPIFLGTIIGTSIGTILFSLGKDALSRQFTKKE